MDTQIHFSLVSYKPCLSLRITNYVYALCTHGNTQGHQQNPTFHMHRNLVDDWMEHYRMTIGMSSPTLLQLDLSPRKSRHGAYSAKQSDRREERRSLMGIHIPDAVLNARIPSAPSREFKDFV